MEGVSAGYGSRTVLSGVSLAVPPGTVHGLIGPNGAGKSTLLRTIPDLGVDSTGRIELCGRDNATLGRLERARLVSYLPQDHDHSSRLTAAETVLLGRHPYRGRRWSESYEDERVAERCMRETGTWELRGRLFSTLSGGERKMVLLAAALAQEPSLLVLDEPGTSLDFRHRLIVWTLLRRLARGGIGVLVSTHEVSVAGRFMDRITVLADGGVTASGSGAEVLTEEVLSRSFRVRMSVCRCPSSGALAVVPEEPL